MEIKRIAGNAKKGLETLANGFEHKVAKIGWFRKAAYPEGTLIAYVAAIQEFGSPLNKIPPRPFLRPTISEKEKDWKMLFESGSKSIIKGSETPISVLDKIGSKAAGDVRKTISLIQEPPLKKSTIRARLRKKSNKSKVGNLTKPLIDTGLMLGTLIHAVEDE